MAQNKADHNDDKTITQVEVYAGVATSAQEAPRIQPNKYAFWRNTGMFMIGLLGLSTVNDVAMNKAYAETEETTGISLRGKIVFPDKEGTVSIGKAGLYVLPGNANKKTDQASQIDQPNAIPKPRLVCPQCGAVFDSVNSNGNQYCTKDGSLLKKQIVKAAPKP